MSTRSPIKTLVVAKYAESPVEGWAERIHDTAVEKGFWDGDWTDEKFMTKLALIHSEVTEILEAVRKSQGDEAELEEIADVLIRLLDYYNARKVLGHFGGQTLTDVVNYKMKKNEGRPTRHGNKF